MQKEGPYTRLTKLQKESAICSYLLVRDCGDSLEGEKCHEGRVRNGGGVGQKRVRKTVNSRACWKKKMEHGQKGLIKSGKRRDGVTSKRVWI